MSGLLLNDLERLSAYRESQKKHSRPSKVIMRTSDKIALKAAVQDFQLFTAFVIGSRKVHPVLAYKGMLEKMDRILAIEAKYGIVNEVLTAQKEDFTVKLKQHMDEILEKKD